MYKKSTAKQSNIHHKILHFFNTLVPSVHKSARISKVLVLELEGIIQKNPMDVMTMSR